MSIKLNFTVLIDDSLSKVSTLDQFSAVLNKKVLSLINDYEDGKWRHGTFQSYIWDNIALTALSQKERSALSTKTHSSLVAAAKNLRLSDKDKKGEGSEIAEIFLYGVMNDYFKALPVVPKIFYKQNTQDNAKGADTVHIVIDGTDFTLWFGEAKFFNSIADARLDAIVKSVYNTLATDKLKKENSIITNVSDISDLNIDADLKERITSALATRNSIDDIKGKINVPIMLLHQCDITSSNTAMSDAYKTSIIQHHKDRADAYFKKQISKSASIFKYDEVKFHLILFPVPNKKIIIDSFTKSVKYYKAQA